MKVALMLTFSAALGLGCWRAFGSPAELSAAGLRVIYDAHDWFKLREAITAEQAPALYRGAVAAAFNRTSEAEEALHPLINEADPMNNTSTSKDGDEAEQWLSYMFVRTGQYQKAAGEMDEGSPLLATLRGLPNQSVSSFAPSSVSCRMLHQRLFVPVQIQAKPVEFFLDSDANFSFMSESEARNLGLTVRGSAIEVHGAGGIATGFRMALADELTVGNVRLKHVAFMVMPDSEEVFARLEANQQGALGLPVLLAFQSLLYRKGSIYIAESSAKVADREQNLCFDGLDPVTRIQFAQQELPAVLDTGAAATELWPPFARQFPAVVNSAGKSAQAVENSFGGKLRVPEKLLADLTVGVGGSDLHLRPARVLLAETTPNSRRYYGRIGLDVLSAHEVKIDFNGLQLSVQ